MKSVSTRQGMVLYINACLSICQEAPEKKTFFFNPVVCLCVSARSVKMPCVVKCDSE